METTMTDTAVKGTQQKMEDRQVPDHTIGEVHVDNARMTARGVDVYYGDKHAIQDVTLDIGSSQVISFIGPSGCGKSTFLRCLNRMNDTIDICRVDGEIKIVEQQLHGAHRTVAVLGHDHFGDAAIRCFRVVVLVAVDHQHQVGVLLD